MVRGLDTLRIWWLVALAGLLGGGLAGCQKAAAPSSAATPPAAEATAVTPDWWDSPAEAHWEPPTVAARVTLEGPQDPRAWRDWLGAAHGPYAGRGVYWVRDAPRLDALPWPEQAEVIGAYQRQFDPSIRETAIYLRLPDDAARRAWQVQLDAAGWRVNRTATWTPPGGFLGAWGGPPGLTATLCHPQHPDTRLDVTFMRLKGQEGLWLQILYSRLQEGKGPAPGCEILSGTPPAPFGPLPDPFRDVPRLRPPAGVTLRFEGGGSAIAAGTNSFAIQEVVLNLGKTSTTLGDLFATFARQLEEGGWERAAAATHEHSAWGRWEKPAADMPYLTLILLREPDAPRVHAILIRTQAPLAEMQAQEPWPPHEKVEVTFRGAADEVPALRRLAWAQSLFREPQPVRIWVGQARERWQGWEADGVRVVGSRVASAGQRPPYATLYWASRLDAAGLQKRLDTVARAHGWEPQSDAVMSAVGPPTLWDIEARAANRSRLYCPKQGRGSIWATLWPAQGRFWAMLEYNPDPDLCQIHAGTAPPWPEFALLQKARLKLPLPGGDDTRFVMWQFVSGDPTRRLASWFVVRTSPSTWDPWWKAVRQSLDAAGWEVQTATRGADEALLVARREIEGRTYEVQIHAAALWDSLWFVHARFAPAAAAGP
ncbi:MAG: hypothetical protein GXO37_00255 [Chloroflexi bacterium]|nr:hypothetical protein [Chloroflexota bacterium]